MTLKETAMLLAYLREYYPNGKDVTDTTVKAWQAILEPFPAELVKACTKNVVMNYEGVTMPPIATIVKEIRNATGSDDSAIELWRIAEGWIRKGTIMRQEDFDRLPKEIKAYFGGVSAFKDLALLDQGELPNERARFLRAIPQIQEREKAIQSLPDSVKAEVALLADKLN